MDSILDFSHKLLKSCIKENSMAVDFTVGNGKDTLFLCELCSKGKVLGFDIQKEAIKSTKNLLMEHNINNIELVLDSHSNIDLYLDEKFDGGIFNLGYLPNGDKNIVTQLRSTSTAIEKSLTLLNTNGIIVVVCYMGHDGGLNEADGINNYLSSLNSKYFSVLKYEFLNRNNCPFILAIKKNL